MLNIFAAPGDAFQDIKDKPVNNANWVTPALIIMFLGWFAGLLIFSQDTIKHQIKDVREKAIQKQMERKHASQQEIDKAIEMAEKYGDVGTIAMAFIAPIFSGFAPPFIWGGIFWLIGAKALGGRFSYMKAVEAVGLAAMIEALEIIIRTLLVLVTGNMFVSPSLALLVKDLDVQNKVHVLLGYINIMTFWLLAVRAVGISKLSNVSFARAALWVFGVWIGYSALIFGIGTAVQQVFSKMGGGG